MIWLIYLLAIWGSFSLYALGAWITKKILHDRWGVMPWRRKYIMWAAATWPIAWPLMLIALPFAKLYEILSEPYR